MEKFLSDMNELLVEETDHLLRELGSNMEMDTNSISSAVYRAAIYDINR